MGHCSYRASCLISLYVFWPPLPLSCHFKHSLSYSQSLDILCLWAPSFIQQGLKINNNLFTPSFLHIKSPNTVYLHFKPLHLGLEPWTAAYFLGPNVAPRPTLHTEVHKLPSVWPRGLNVHLYSSQSDAVVVFWLQCLPPAPFPQDSAGSSAKKRTPRNTVLLI